MANFNNIESIRKSYSPESHESYMASQGGELPAVVAITPADEDGDFSIRHGYLRPATEFSTGLRLPVQGEYSAMIEWIVAAAKDGEL